MVSKLAGKALYAPLCRSEVSPNVAFEIEDQCWAYRQLLDLIL